MNRSVVSSAFSIVSLGACLFVGGCQSADADPDAAPSAFAVSLPPATAAQVLALVNYPANDADVLHGAAGLDPRAATNIVAHRNGKDGISPSADDQYFTDIASLDATPYVGDSAFEKLESYAQAHPAPAPETVEGVAFQGWQSQSVVWAVDHDTQAALDALIDSRAATNLVAHRPFVTVTQMGPISYVGATALGHLRDNSITFWNQMRASSAPSLAGTFDSVSFDEATAEVALAIANQATGAQLTAHGVTPSAANKIIAARPFTALGQVAAVSGVGTATMTALHSYAAGGQWPPPLTGNQCIAAFEAAVQPHLGDLLFLSESDRPFDIVSFPGQGKTAPTVDSLLALVTHDPGATTEVRAVADYYVDFEPSGSGADPNAATLVEAAINAQLTNLIYVAIIPPLGGPDQAEVDVYLVGTTSCGDLVGLHAISIET